MAILYFIESIGVSSKTLFMSLFTQGNLLKTFWVSLYFKQPDKADLVIQSEKDPSSSANSAKKLMKPVRGDETESRFSYQCTPATFWCMCHNFVLSCCIMRPWCSFSWKSLSLQYNITLTLLMADTSNSFEVGAMFFLQQVVSGREKNGSVKPFKTVELANVAQSSFLSHVCFNFMQYIGGWREGSKCTRSRMNASTASTLESGLYDLHLSHWKVCLHVKKYVSGIKFSLHLNHRLRWFM